MKKMKRIFPVVCISAFMIITSQMLFHELLKREETKCWQELSTTAKAVNREITRKFQDEIVKLHLLEAIMIEDDIFDASTIGKLHINTIQPTTIFSRIDVLYPDQTLISNGVTHVVRDNIRFEDVVANGEGLTERKTDFMTGKECIYYVLPVLKDGEIFSVLVGMIDADSLSEIFRPLIYNGQANICIIDSEDGSYIMDSWHDELGNAYETGDRKKKKGYEDVDLQKALKNLETGAAAFESQTTGKNLYMYYTPMGMFDWQLSIFAQEDVLFGNLLSLRRVFLFARIAETFLLMLYFAWNIGMVNRLENSNAEIEKQKEQLKHISYSDMLTSMYNRNKYIEVCSALRKQEQQSAGVAYIDLNGLKQINDTQSHEAGDYYICSAARIISQLFEKSCYRIGGDEFVILTISMEREQFMEKMEMLKEKMQSEHVSISVGFLWEESCDDLDALLKEAERRMYQEKKEYHLIHGR